MAQLVEFKPSELAQLPVELWQLTQQFPLSFDRYFEHLINHEEPQNDFYEIFFDDEDLPAISWIGEEFEDGNKFDGEPTILNIFKDNTLIYFEVFGHSILLDERPEDFPDFKVLLSDG